MSRPAPEVHPVSVAATDRVTVHRLAVGEAIGEAMARDVRAGLTASPRILPPKWFYDAVGSALFERITELPEYYQTRTETSILERVVDDIVAAVRPVEVVELGSGSSRKTRLLLTAMHEGTGGDRYLALEVSEDALRGAAAALTVDLAWLRVDGVVGDFDHHLGALPRQGRGIVAFLGGTIGNLTPAEQAGFVAAVVAGMAPGDAFLLGVDLVPSDAPGSAKTTAQIVAAYDDAAGVTDAFNRNVLHVLVRELQAEIDVDAFAHEARYDPRHARIEMWLRATRPTRMAFPTLDLVIDLAAGEGIRTEISCKFTRARAEALLTGAGLELARWDEDPQGRFALALSRLP